MQLPLISNMLLECFKNIPEVAIGKQKVLKYQVLFALKFISCANKHPERIK
jgi:hypothetical protein